LNHASGAQPAETSRTRRRPSRTGSSDRVSLQSASPPHDDGDGYGVKGTKAGRNTLKKAPRRDSLLIDTSPGQTAKHLEDPEDIGGFIPRLGQIREGKVSRTTGSRIGSTIESKSRRRRHGEEHSGSRSYSRHKHGSLHRRAESLAELSNPSLVSVLSGSTQQSNVSGGSNSTVTQQAYDGLSLIAQRRFPDIPAATHMTKGPARSKQASMDTPQSNVFQYMQEAPPDEDDHESPSSTIDASSSASSSDSENDDAESKSANSDTRDTPTTSPASTRTSHPDTSRRPRSHRKPGVPLYASSFVHGPADHEEAEDDGGSEPASDGESDEGESEEEEDEDNGGPYVSTSDHAPHLALEKVLPPRVPSASSRHSDPHIRRLRQQERELANHVLQSPQPQKDFQFAGAPSPHHPPVMPLYSPRAYSGATPESFEATSGYQADWPPFPPPLPIGYPTQSSLESPAASHAMPLTVQPPLGVPSLPVQQHVPPFLHHLGQPPRYQAQLPAHDETRTTVAGYELVASKLSESPKAKNVSRRAGSLVPMYRKFEHLNHRILLHLQDEVCELEEELRYLDESIVQTSPKNEAGQIYPASRRGDAQYGSKLHFKRTELLGRVFQKLGQYSEYSPKLYRTKIQDGKDSHATPHHHR
jgi:hypothetical protein